MILEFSIMKDEMEKGKKRYRGILIERERGEKYI
jgi:hypothetical protein